MLDAPQEPFQKIEVEHGLGNGVLGARFHFQFEAMDLFVQVQRPGICAHAQQQRPALGLHSALF